MRQLSSKWLPYNTIIDHLYFFLKKLQKHISIQLHDFAVFFFFFNNNNNN